ncbi:MAG: hypothetical protein ACUVXF_08390 [Desulfobaccales bacterium]
MNKKATRLFKVGSILLLLLFLAWTIPSEAWARAGRGMSGGGSFGSRGSRSMTPVRPYTPPASPSVQPTKPATPSPSPTSPRPIPAAPPEQTGGFWRSFGTGLLGGFAGGMLARWLFGGTPAEASPKAGGQTGFNLLDLILLAGIGLLIYWFVAKRRREKALALQGVSQSSMADTSIQPPYYELPSSKLAKPQGDLEEGLRHIEQLDPLFSEDRFKDQAMDFFFKIQGA